MDHNVGYVTWSELQITWSELESFQGNRELLLYFIYNPEWLTRHGPQFKFHESSSVTTCHTKLLARPT